MDNQIFIALWILRKIITNFFLKYTEYLIVFRGCS